jgi:hypothetical protein
MRGPTAARQATSETGGCLGAKRSSPARARIALIVSAWCSRFFRYTKPPVVEVRRRC